MGNIVPYTLMAVAVAAAFYAQFALLAARERLRAAHPEDYEAMSKGGGMRLGGPDDRVRRQLARPMLFGLPPRLKADETLAKLAERFRLALLAVAASLGGVGLIIALRAQAVG